MSPVCCCRSTRIIVLDAIGIVGSADAVDGAIVASSQTMFAGARVFAAVLGASIAGADRALASVAAIAASAACLLVSTAVAISMAVAALATRRSLAQASASVVSFNAITRAVAVENVPCTIVIVVSNNGSTAPFGRVSTGKGIALSDVLLNKARGHPKLNIFKGTKLSLIRI